MKITKAIHVSKTEIVKMVERKYNFKLNFVRLTGTGLEGEIDESAGNL